MGRSAWERPVHEVKDLSPPRKASEIVRSYILRMLFVRSLQNLEGEHLQRFAKRGPGEALPDRSPVACTRSRLPPNRHDAVVLRGLPASGPYCTLEEP